MHIVTTSGINRIASQIWEEEAGVEGHTEGLQSIRGSRDLRVPHYTGLDTLALIVMSTQLSQRCSKGIAVCHIDRARYSTRLIWQRARIESTGSLEGAACYPYRFAVVVVVAVV